MRIITAIAMTTTTLLASGYALSDAPKLHVTQTIAIDASAGKVWDAAKNFNALNTWLPPVAKDEIVEGTNNTVGAVRVLTLKDGGTVKEKLLAFNEAGRSFRYTIVESVLPVSDYTSTFSVTSAGKGKAKATWTGHFRRKNVGDNPAANESDKAAIDTMTGVYQTGLQTLKKVVEANSQ
jgi:mxaD protein